MSRRDPSLFNPGPANPDTLRDRQRLVYEQLRLAGPDGMEADDCGALLHERNGKHDRADRCDWCGSDGRQVLLRLAELDLAVKKRRGPWVAAEHATQTTVTRETGGGPYNPETQEIPY